MATTDTGWWRRHGWTVAILLSAFAFAFLIRTVWSYPVIGKWGPLYVYAGGSDSYYHSRVMQYIITTGHNLIHDPMLKYPIGGTNPREPLFDWMNAILGLIFAPFFGGNAVVAGAWFLDLQGPLWAALEVFPLYLIGREVSSKRTGLIAALILPFLSAGITSSTFGYANYLSFYTFMILVVIYSYLRTLKALGTHRYVEQYRSPRQFLAGLRLFYHREHTAVKWGVFTGVSLGALALSWQGYTYAIVVIGFGLLIAMVVERIRHVDSFSLYVTTWIIGLVAIPMMLPYYLVQGDLRTFFDLPVLLLFGVLALMLPFLLLRDVPWVFSLPALIGLVGAAALFLRFALPAYFADIVTGQGYFVKTLIYSTVAEAQPPSFDGLVVGYGVFTFFLAFVGLAIFAYLLARHRFKRYHIALVVYAVVSLYLPISATKFFLVGSPAYALLSAEALHRALDVGSYPELRRTVASLSDRRNQFAAFRRAFKPRHVLVLAVVLAVVLPNVWFSLDAGIPGNTKGAVANQINLTIPSWLKLNSSEPASNYLGATGTDLDTPNQYDSAAYTWLSQQDANVPEPQRPAFVSWWDYGFQAIDQGQHPSVADNFQNGIDPAGQFLLSQNESLGIGVLTTALLSAEETISHVHHLPSGLETLLARDGVNVTKVESLLANPASDYHLVVTHPDVYLPVNPSTITNDNAMYLAVSYALAQSLSLTQISKVYDDVQRFTGWSIRYGMVDSRLFPFSGTDTGIFYAPADLTGRVINAAGLPTTFFNVTVLGNDNQTYPLGGLPSGVGATQYNINYFAPFYNTMLYHTYIGYNGTDAGQAGGIPGLSGAAAGDRLEPGWMLQHFEIVYRTAYYCAGVKNASNGSSCMLPANLPTARSLSKSTNGTLDASSLSYFRGGETMLAYFPGETLDGVVTLPGGLPDPGVRATVYDNWGIPHMTTVTGKDGSFSLVLPPGNDTLNLTTGAFDKLTQAGKSVLRSIKIPVAASVGYSLDPTTISERYTLAPSTVQGYVYWNNANNSSYKPVADTVISGAQVVFSPPGALTNFTATTDASGTYSLPNVPPGNYSLTVHYLGRKYVEAATLVAPGATVNVSAGLTPSLVTGNVTGPNGAGYTGATVTLTGPPGIVFSTTSGGGGAFGFRSVAPGNYTAVASVPGTALRSVGTPVSITSTGQTPTVPLKLVAMSPVSVTVTAASAPVAGIAVRFTPVISFASGGTSGMDAVTGVNANGTVAITGADGRAAAALPVGTYAVYALGYVGGTLWAGLGQVTSAANGLTAATAVSLSPALALTGTITPVGTAAQGTSALVALAPSGGELVARTTASGTYSVELPAGLYDLLALEGTTGTTPVTDAALSQINLTRSTAVTLTPSPATEPRFAVYANLTKDTTYIAQNASVTVSIGPGGASFTQLASANGSITLFLPSSIPGSASGYCLTGAAPGYRTSQVCGYSPSALAGLSTFRLTPAPVPVTLTVVGLPTGASVTVNVTAYSPTAVSAQVVGGPRFSLSLTPGTYRIEAFASVNHGTTLYAPADVRTARVPFGAGAAAISVPVLAEILAHGTLSLPSGTTAANTTVVLSSPTENVTVNGTDYLSGFRIAQGNFTAAVNATGASGALANLTGVTVSSGGSIAPKLVLNHPGVKLSGSLVSTTNSTLSLNGSLTLHGSGGALLTETVTKGKFSAFLPQGRNFSVRASFRDKSSGPNGSYFVTWSPVAGASCAVGTVAATCTVHLSSVRNPAWLNGTVERAGGSAPVPSTLRLIGPYPTANLTVEHADNGSFALHLAPGAYAVYAIPSDGSPFAGFAQTLALPGAGQNVTVFLGPATTDAITVSGSGTPGQTLGAISLSVTAPGGQRVVFPGIAAGATTSVLLPAGSYTVRATAPGTLNGVGGTATVSATVSIGAGGNLATHLALGLVQRPAVVGTLVGPHASNITVTGPYNRTATFSFSLRSSGNVPVTVHPVGSPSFWSFNFSFTNVTLVPGGSAVSGEVRITVPPGTAVDHPPVSLSFVDANGTTVGNVSPAPVVHVAPYPGVKVGHSAAHPSSVGAQKASVPFYLKNNGNAAETVRLSVGDAARLAGIGWSYTIQGETSPNVPRTLNLSAAANESLTVNLTFTGRTFVAPGSITLLAQVENVSHAPSSTVTISVPITKVKLSSSHGSGLTVVGPGIGSPSKYLPEWALLVIVFVPTILLLAFVIARRWWATRRWSRW